MNLILFSPAEAARPLPLDDRRAVHLLRVLRRRAGETFDAGLINGPRGKGTVVAIGPEALTLSFAWAAEPAALDPITLIVGLPRPQTARDILRDATSLGVAAIHFVVTEKGERNYAGSTLWTSDEWRRHLIAGAEQAFDTRLPEVTHGRPLTGTISTLPPETARLALDNYDAAGPLSAQPLPAGALALAFGPERGWSKTERACLHGAGFSFGHLGRRVLRLETAVTAALALIKAKRGLM
jgi:16S rRNA (uracil1498-N3)-methyltransferase